MNSALVMCDIDCFPLKAEFILERWHFFFFLSLCDELQHFHSDSNATAREKMLMQSVFQMTNRILCHERENALEIELFSTHVAIQLMR